MAISKITTRGFNFANTLSRGDFTDTSFGDIVLLENEVGGLLMDASASGVDVDGHILYNNNESAFFFRDISSTQLSDGAVTLSKISSDTKDQLNEDHIALENEDGNLLLNSSAASTDEGDRIVFNEVFNPSTFNIGGTLTAGNAIKIDSSGLGFEFGSGGLVLVTSVTLSNVASVAFTSIDSTYETYVFMLNNVVPVSDGVQLYMRTSTDGGSSYDSGSSDYDTRSCAVNNSNSFEATGSVDSTFMSLNQGASNIGSASGEGISLVVHLYQPSNSSLFTTMSYQGTAIYSEGSMRPQFGSGARMATESVDAVQFLMSSGNLESGEINMYGGVK